MLEVIMTDLDDNPGLLPQGTSMSLSLPTSVNFVTNTQHETRDHDEGGAAWSASIRLAKVRLCNYLTGLRVTTQ